MAETLRKKLLAVQTELKAPKNQFNSFGKYNYRSCEDILEAVKPLLAKNDCNLTISDEVVEVGGRVYVKATATLFDDSAATITTSAFARESEVKSGMDSSQITGSSSSYARKYCLNGMFLIDDTKDADATNTHGKEEKKEEAKATLNQVKLLNKLDDESKKKMLSYFHVKSPEDLTMAQASEVIKQKGLNA